MRARIAGGDPGICKMLVVGQWTYPSKRDEIGIQASFILISKTSVNIWIIYTGLRSHIIGEVDKGAGLMIGAGRRKHLIF